MSIANINHPGAAAALSRSRSVHTQATDAKAVVPAFSRKSDAEKLPSLGQACQINGVIPNFSFLEKAVVGDLLRVVRAIRSGDMEGAKGLLSGMSHIKLDEFCKKNKVDPSFVAELRKVVDSKGTPAQKLSEAFEVLHDTGADKLNSGLRPAKQAQA